MAFLVKTDNQEKFVIPKGETVIGRGPYLRVKELSLSRSHALLSLSNGKLCIKPTHKNPTYFNSPNSFEENGNIVLMRDEWKELFDGDCISLLADSLKYRVEIVPPEVSIKNQIGDKEELVNGSEDERRIVHELTEDCNTTSNTICREDDSVGACEMGSEFPCRKGQVEVPMVNQKSPRKRTLPAWMLDSEASPQEKKVKSSKPSPKQVSSSVETDELSMKLGISDVLLNKKTSQEHDLDLSSINSSQIETSPRPGLSKEDTIEENVKNEAFQSDDKSEASTKLCPYGRKCYRKNPIHFQEYSHPSKENNNDDDDDPENSSGSKSECPYGMKCYRQNNPFHTKKFTHESIGKERVSRRKRKQRKGKSKSLLDNESDADGENEYDFNDSFLASSDDSGGYSDDSDDSDYAPPRHEQSDDEDYDELVAEAKGFISNKKM